ncbi:MAG: hypothetical protein JSV17_12075 [Candidatus Aminicenantes bacterium]|nr:MAG: hypothetical protein JSV17_12075 [Candidatus Aminicenantes bacterium]
MMKQKIGLVLFWMAIIWAIGWGVIGSVFVDSAFRNLTMDELNQTMWASEGTWTMIWGLFGVPLAAIVAIIGIMLYSGAKASTALTYGIGIFIAVFAGMMAGYVGHIPLLFGIGGTLILLFFIGILWFWAKERKALEGASSAAANLKLAGYVFMLIAAWFTCGIASQPFLKALDKQSPSTPLHVIIFLVLGWFFLFLGFSKSHKQ